MHPPRVPKPCLPTTLRLMIVAIALLVGSALLYAKTVGFGFVNFDDADYVTQNLHVQAGLTWEGLRWTFTTFHGANWFPVTWLSHMLDAQLFGPWAGGHHLTSVLLHALNALLLAYLLFRLTGEFWQSCLVAALFALHPLQVESVAWVSERKNVLSTWFFLATLYAYLHYTQQPCRSRYLGVLLLYALGLMTKPMLVSLPLVLLLLDWWPLGRLTASPLSATPPTGLHRCIVEKLPLLLMSLASSVITLLAQRHGEALVSAEILPLGQRLGRALLHYGWYLGKLVWPTDLAFFYPVLTRIHPGKAVATGLVLAGITLLALQRRQREPFLLTGWLWFLVTLVPVIGVVAVGMQGTADRYAYLPAIGFFIALVWSWGKVLDASGSIPCWGRIVAATALLLLLSLLTWKQQDAWRDSLSLGARAVAVTRDNYVALTIWGDALDDAGDSDAAIRNYQQALRIRPEYDIAHNSLGVTLCKQGRTDDALREFATAVRLRPAYADAYVNMGICLAGSGRLVEAAGHFRTALKVKPDHATASQGLEQVLLELARHPAAAR